MASGNFSLGTSNQIKGRITWTSTSNGTDANTSTVTATIQVARTDSYTTTGTWAGALNIGGTTKDFSVHTAVSSNWVTLLSFSITKAHSNNGKGTCYISGSIKGPSGTSQANSSVYDNATVTLDTIPRAATISSAPNFNDEANPTIKYDNPAGNDVESLQACISLDGSADDIAYRNISKTGSSYTFNLTDAERAVLRKATTNSNSRTVRFYVQTVINGTTYRKYLSKTLSIVNADPAVNPTIIDTNSVTTSLTGDSNTLIRYFSNAKITFGASALKNATIKSRKVTCGSKSLSADGTINAIESGTFKFTVTDSRGNSTTKTVNKSIVNYVKLSAGLSSTNFNTDGVISFRVKGNYFNGSFGTTSNVLIVQYRYKVSGGNYGDWIPVEAAITNNTYTADVSITGLDYQQKYIIQAKVIDELSTVSTIEKTMSCIPLFDWGENDFKFNVPVNFSNNIKINGITTDGTELNAFQPCNGNNNCVIGYGGYTGGIGATNLYGNDVNILTNTDLTINDGDSVYSLLGAVKAMSKVYELNCTVTTGSGYSNCNATAYLLGNNLRVYMTATRSENTNAGDIVNETVMTIKVNHSGKIASLYAVGFASATTGAPATFYSSIEKNDNNNHTITISLCGTSVGDNGWSGYYTIPCTLNLAAFL